MKKGIHPEYMPAVVTCSCGERFYSRSTVPRIKVEICSKCHPFFTGKEKIIDAEGRVERFRRRYQHRRKTAEAQSEATPPSPEA